MLERTDITTKKRIAKTKGGIPRLETLVGYWSAGDTGSASELSSEKLNSPAKRWAVLSVTSSSPVA